MTNIHSRAITEPVGKNIEGGRKKEYGSHG